MDEETKRYAEISHVLEQLVELGTAFSGAALPAASITKIVHKIDRNKLDDTERAVYDSICATINYENNKEIYDNIIFKDHSFKSPGNFDNRQVAAAFFEDKYSGDVYFSARGTGNYRWPDNGTLMTVEESLLQGKTCEYFDYVIGHIYKEGLPENGNLILAGHSKGGNDAQYITLFSKHRELIDICFNFDGPGFSDEARNRFFRECEEEGIDPNEILNKIYGIVGENDFVFNRGRNIMIPDENIYYVSTPDAKEFANFHHAHFMSSPSGLNWQADGNGIINGEPGTIGKLSILLQEMEREFPKNVYEASSMSIMSIIEMGLGAGSEARDVEWVGWATPEQWQLFLKEGLPTMLDLLRDNPDLLHELPDLLFDINLPPIVTDAIAGTLLDIASWLPHHILVDSTTSFIVGGNANWPAIGALIFSALPEIGLQKMLPILFLMASALVVKHLSTHSMA